jgi:type I restriction enzyme S subunit
LAVQGKLTRAWRGRHPELVEREHSAQALLERIKAEKAQLIADKKIKKEKPLPAIKEDEIPYELPEGWEWCRLGDLITFLNGYAYKSSTYVEDSKFQVIRLGNVKNDRFLIDVKQAYVPETIGSQTLDYKLYEGDILTTLTGTKNKRDYCFTCMVKPEHLGSRTLLLNQRVGCIRPIDFDSSELMNKFLKSNVELDQLFATESGTANQGNIGSTAFKNLIYPLPPKEEQKAIVQQVNALMALCDQLENEIATRTTTLEDWMKSWVGGLVISRLYKDE